jgi:hypothetical protein
MSVRLSWTSPITVIPRGLADRRESFNSEYCQFIITGSLILTFCFPIFAFIRSLHFLSFLIDDFYTQFPANVFGSLLTHSSELTRTASCPSIQKFQMLICCTKSAHSSRFSQFESSLSLCQIYSFVADELWRFGSE